MQISVIGAGYVGLATAVGLALQGHTARVFEIDAGRRTALQHGRVPFLEPELSSALPALAEGRLSFPEPADWVGATEIAFICVGTPSRPDGALDVTEVLNASRFVSERRLAPVLAIRSTVPPGTALRVMSEIGGATAACEVVSNPEFLREGSALADFSDPARRVVGTESDAAAQVLQTLYSFSDAPIVRTDPTTAELIKLGANAMLAVRVSVVNELADLAAASGADVDAMFNGIGSDPRIGLDFLRPGIGFGGSCLPKDLDAMRASLRDAGARANVFDAAATTNQEGLSRLTTRVSSLITVDERVGIIGLGFKVGTDSIRGSRPLRLAEMLLELGYRVDVFDPLAEANAREVLGDRVTYLEAPSEIFTLDRLVVLSHGRQELPQVPPQGTIVIDGLGQILASSRGS